MSVLDKFLSIMKLDDDDFEDDLFDDDDDCAPLQSHPVPLTLRVAFVKGPCGEELEFFKATVREE